MNTRCLNITRRSIFIRIGFISKKHKRYFLLFNLYLGYGRLTNYLAEGWQFRLNGPQVIEGLMTFRGINYTKVVRSIL